MWLCAIRYLVRQCSQQKSAVQFLMLSIKLVTKTLQENEGIVCNMQPVANIVNQTRIGRKRQIHSMENNCYCALNKDS